MPDTFHSNFLLYCTYSPVHKFVLYVLMKHCVNFSSYNLSLVLDNKIQYYREVCCCKWLSTLATPTWPLSSLIGQVGWALGRVGARAGRGRRGTWLAAWQHQVLQMPWLRQGVRYQVGIRATPPDSHRGETLCMPAVSLPSHSENQPAEAPPHTQRREAVRLPLVHVQGLAESPPAESHPHTQQRGSLHLSTLSLSLY